MDDPGSPQASSPPSSSRAEPAPSTSPPPAEATGPSGLRVGRRALVAGGLGALVASALTRLQTAHAQDDVPPPQAPLLLGTDNVAFDTTALLQDGPGPTLQVENLDSGAGIRVLTTKAPAVQARSPGVGVMGTGGPLPSQRPITDTFPASTAAGVLGASRRVGVMGAALPDTGLISIPRTDRVGVPVGVWGSGGPLASSVILTTTRTATGTGVGVWGSAPSLPGVGTISYTVGAAGVLGTAFGEGQTAMLAHNPGGTALRVDGALQVDGGIRVTCGGRGVVPRQRSETEVWDPTLKASSIVAVTLTGDPGNKGATLHHVEVEEGHLRIVLTAPPRRDTPFSYLCLELA